MTEMISKVHPLFLQGGAVAKRLRGVNSRFESGNGGVDTNVLLYALALLVSVATVLVIRQIVIWHRWGKLAGADGLGLDNKSVKKWWKFLSKDLQQNPHKLFDSRERIAAELERLVAADQGDLARLVHECWIRSTPDVRNPLSGLENLLQTEMILIRDQDGKIILEGFMRRVGTDSIDMVPFRKTSMQEVGLGKDNVDIDRNVGCESIYAKVMKTSTDGRLWTFSIGVAAQVDHQRQEFRIRTPLGALVFDKRHNALSTVKADMDTSIVPTHHLLAKEQRERTVTYADLMRRKKLFYSARLCHLNDLSALGARLQLDDSDNQLIEDQSVYLFLPFVINGKVEESLIIGKIVEIWQEPNATNGESTIARLRFIDIEDSELLAMRRLVNVLNATPIENQSSDAQELCDQYRYSNVE